MTAMGSATNNKRSGDIETAVSNNKNSQKEKRPYKKRKHKNQRDKLPYPSPGKIIEYKNKIYAISFLSRFLNPKLMFQLQFNSGPAIESMLSSDEDEQSSNQLGQEAEDEGLFQFRRSNASQYHKVLYFMTKTQISYISMNFVFNINYCCLLLLIAASSS